MVHPIHAMNRFYSHQEDETEEVKSPGQEEDKARKVCDGVLIYGVHGQCTNQACNLVQDCEAGK